MYCGAQQNKNIISLSNSKLKNKSLKASVFNQQATLPRGAKKKKERGLFLSLP